jgi:DNA-directed RNA polymerase subunit RPC12/RpoP
MKNIICKLRGHNLRKLNTSLSLIGEYKCTNCNKEFTTNGYGRIVHLTAYWKNNNSQFKKSALLNLNFQTEQLVNKMKLIGEYKCTNCNKEFTRNGYGRIAHLTVSWKNNNSQLKKNVLLNQNFQTEQLVSEMKLK